MLRRKITTQYGQNRIYIEDEIKNEGFRKEPMMLLYHMNVGYPFLCEDSEIMIPSRKVTPRDDTSAMNAAKWDKMETPKDNEPEYVFLHDMAADRVGNTFAAIVNSKLGIGLKIVKKMK